MANVRYGFTPTHPGEVLKDEIEYRKISQSKLAKQMGMSYKILNDILKRYFDCIFGAYWRVGGHCWRQLKNKLYQRNRNKRIINRPKGHKIVVI